MFVQTIMLQLLKYYIYLFYCIFPHSMIIRTSYLYIFCVRRRFCLIFLIKNLLFYFKKEAFLISNLIKIDWPAFSTLLIINLIYNFNYRRVIDDFLGWVLFVCLCFFFLFRYFYFTFLLLPSTRLYTYFIFFNTPAYFITGNYFVIKLMEIILCYINAVPMYRETSIFLHDDECTSAFLFRSFLLFSYRLIEIFIYFYKIGLYGRIMFVLLFVAFC